MWIKCYDFKNDVMGVIEVMGVTEVMRVTGQALCVCVCADPVPCQTHVSSVSHVNTICF